MTFDQVLPLLRDGRKARRRFWKHLHGNTGLHVEIRDINPIGPTLVCPRSEGQVNLFACSQWDILANDWELIQ